MLTRTREETVMKTPNQLAAFALLALLSQTSRADEVVLPAPVLEWSFYVLLIFALFVAVGIFYFRSGNNKKDQPVGRLPGQHDPRIHSVRPEVTVSECVRLMNEQDIGAMLVIEDDELLGIFTERDAMTKVLGTGLEPSYTKVSAVMSNNPICITPATTVDEAMAIVTHQRIRHLPVVQDGETLGLVSSGDLTHWLVSEQPSEIQQLVDIAGGGKASR